MKVTVIGSHQCPDTLYALCELKRRGAEIDFCDLSSSLQNLKTYLALRDRDPLYEQVRGTDRLGIPCFLLPDGSKTMDLDALLK